MAVPLPYSWPWIRSTASLIGLGADHREHRPEDLLAVDLHVRLDVVEQRAADEEAVLVALQREAAAIDDQLGACFDARVDVADDLVALRLGDDRAHLRVLVGRRADLERSRRAA